MNQVQNIKKVDDKNLQQNDSNRFSTCEEIVETLVNRGLPKTFSPDNFINKISSAFGVNKQEARTCLKLAIKQLEANSIEEKEKPEEKLNAQSGYFYPQGYTIAKTNHSIKRDGMDSLNSLGSYNKMMFGIK